MGGLAFADSMTGHLVWPLIVLILALVYKRPIVQMLGRLRRFKWGDREAELQDIATAKTDVEVALQDATERPADATDITEGLLKERIERVMTESAKWGFALAQLPEMRTLPELNIRWREGGRPELEARGPAMRAYLTQLATDVGASEEQAPKMAEWALAQMAFYGRQDNPAVLGVPDKGSE